MESSLARLFSGVGGDVDGVKKRGSGVYKNSSRGGERFVRPEIKKRNKREKRNQKGVEKAKTPAEQNY